ncbi:MAG: glycosyltransferase family 4 protein [Ruminococcaceae bacterium]|nr:glycosyltransferase family 4 protein [Oscillospiraceae bacterium]
MKDVLIISNYWHFRCEKSSSRYLTIANMLANEDVDVEVITSSFYHTQKKHRSKGDIKDEIYKFTLIDEPGYDKNISLKRIYSHGVFAKKVIDYLKKRKKPDVIYLFVPPVDLAYSVMKFAKKNNVKFVIDILDLWPEAYKMAFSLPVISDIIFYPMMKKANAVYKNADEIVAVSQTYVDRALQCNKKVKNGHSVFIGTDLAFFDKFKTVPDEKNDEEFKIAYIGMLGKSYDIECVIRAMKIIKDKHYDKIRFVVMGDGFTKPYLEKLAKELDVNVVFTGRLPYEEMVCKLTSCNATVNPIISKAKPSLINKHADYFSSGLPFLNTQKCKELENLITEYNAGFNCENEDENDLADKIITLYQNPDLAKKMGKNSRKLAEDMFDRNKTYYEIIDVIKGE